MYVCKNCSDLKELKLNKLGAPLYTSSRLNVRVLGEHTQRNDYNWEQSPFFWSGLKGQIIPDPKRGCIKVKTSHFQWIWGHLAPRAGRSCVATYWHLTGLLVHHVRPITVKRLLFESIFEFWTTLVKKIHLFNNQCQEIWLEFW